MKGKQTSNIKLSLCCISLAMKIWPRDNQADFPTKLTQPHWKRRECRREDWPGDYCTILGEPAGNGGYQRTRKLGDEIRPMARINSQTSKLFPLRSGQI